MNEERETKLVYFQVVDADQKEVDALGKALVGLKKGLQDKLSYDIEFLIGNEKVNLYSIKYMIDELIKLYKKTKELKNTVKKERTNPYVDEDIITKEKEYLD